MILVCGDFYSYIVSYTDEAVSNINYFFVLSTFVVNKRYINTRPDPTEPDLCNVKNLRHNPTQSTIAPTPTNVHVCFNDDLASVVAQTASLMT